MFSQQSRDGYCEQPPVFLKTEMSEWKSYYITVKAFLKLEHMESSIFE